MTRAEEQINILSEALLGHREGVFLDILNKAKELRKLELVKELVEVKEEVLEVAQRAREVFAEL